MQQVINLPFKPSTVTLSESNTVDCLLFDASTLEDTLEVINSVSGIFISKLCYIPSLSVIQNLSLTIVNGFNPKNFYCKIKLFFSDDLVVESENFLLVDDDLKNYGVDCYSGVPLKTLSFSTMKSYKGEMISTNTCSVPIEEKTVPSLINYDYFKTKFRIQDDDLVTLFKEQEKDSIIGLYARENDNQNEIVALTFSGETKIIILPDKTPVITEGGILGADNLTTQTLCSSLSFKLKIPQITFNDKGFITDYSTTEITIK